MTSNDLNELGQKIFLCCFIIMMVLFFAALFIGLPIDAYWHYRGAVQLSQEVHAKSGIAVHPSQVDKVRIIITDKDTEVHIEPQDTD